MSSKEENIEFMKALAEERYKGSLKKDLPITFTVYEEDVKYPLSGDYFIDQSRKYSFDIFHQWMLQ